MLHKLEIGDEKVVAYRWEGAFDEKGAKQSLVQFIPELNMHSKLNLYIEVVNLTQVEAKALWDGIKYDVMNINELTGKIEKISLVTDLDWMRNLASTSSAFIPGIRLKAFKFEESEAARAFVKK